MGKMFRKECAYCSKEFETKNPRQKACPNCRSVFKYRLATLSETPT